MLSVTFKDFNPPPPTRVTLTVTKTADTNDGVCDADCSLREALAVAGSNVAPDTIRFNIPANSAGCIGSECSIILTSPLTPAADGSRLTTIEGTGTNTITLSGNGATQLLLVLPGRNIKLNSLNLTGAGGGNGAPIAAFSGGLLTVTNSAFYGNTNNSSSAGGALRCESSGFIDLTNVTISGNVSANGGGGISNNGTVTATNCTITGNSGGIGAGAGGVDGGCILRNTIIAGNTSGLANNADVSGAFTSQGHNLIGKVDGATGFTGTGDQTGTVAAPLDPQLVALANNGGPTRTHALQMASTAINAGDNALAPAYDQRYLLRNGTSDIGAYEFNGLTPSVKISSITHLATGHVSFRASE